MTLVGRFRIPLSPKSAAMLVRLLEEYPEHALSVDGVWLEVYA